MFKRSKNLVVMIMVFGILWLTACNSDNFDAYKTTGKEAIETYAHERKNNYSEDNWTVVCSIVTAGKQAVDAAESKHAVDTAVSTAKEKVDKVKMNDFILTITVNKSTVTHGDRITASAIFKNNSGTTVEIATQRLISWYIADWCFSEYVDDNIPAEPYLQQIEKGDNHVGTYNLDVDPEQKLGVFELQATVEFYLNYGTQNVEQVVINSNIIIITVQ